MAWTIGYEHIYISGKIVECAWEVDADSEESAKNSDLTPYILVGVDDLAYPEPQHISWISAQELREMDSEVYVVTNENNDNGDAVLALLSDKEVSILADAMDNISKDVTVSEFFSEGDE